MSETIESIANDLKNSTPAFAFTGAGISAESGIATYRGQGRVWTKYDPNIYANINHFLQDPTYYWSFFIDVRYPMISKAKPNPGHQALADLEKAGKLECVITQNIDELHQQAGSRSVIELHGTTKSYYGLSCSKQFDFDTVCTMAREANLPPCSDCNGMIRPDVVFFGESLKSDVLRSAFEEAQQCDFILAIGSSLVVYLAADIPVQAKRGGAV